MLVYQETATACPRHVIVSTPHCFLCVEEHECFFFFPPASAHPCWKYYFFLRDMAFFFSSFYLFFLKCR